MKISCIIPTLDRPEMLREALESVFTQTRPVDEILIIDNGATPTVMPAEYAARVKVLRLPPRSGVSKARNAGAAAATSDVLAFLDDDDLWSPAYVENAANALAEADCVVSRLDSMKDGLVAPYKNADGNLTVENLLLFNPGVTGSNIVITKSVFVAAGGFDAELPTSEDKSLILELLQKGARVRTLPENHAIQRLHERERLTDPETLARGVALFTKKYRSRMSARTYFFNRRKYFRLRTDAGALSAYSGLVLYAVLYRLTRYLPMV